jgi:hypothetical protein
MQHKKVSLPAARFITCAFSAVLQHVLLLAGMY